MAENLTYVQTHKIFWIDNCSFFRVNSDSLYQLSTERKRRSKRFLMSTLACVINRRDNLLVTQLNDIPAIATWH